MIRGDAFVQRLREAGFGLFTGVPCSYLTPLIDTTIASRDLDYVGATNEGDAVAIACGSELGGRPAVVMMQNSGLGNAVSPLTSLAATFRIPVLVIVTWRGHPHEAPDEPQHGLMGRITRDLLSVMEIPSEEVPTTEEELPAALARATCHMRKVGTPYALVLRKGIVTRGAGVDLPQPLAATRQPHREARSGRKQEAHEQDDVLRAIQQAAEGGDVLLTTTGFTGRALYALDDRPNQLYMVGSMGCVSSFALGLAKAQPSRRVIAIDGDGAALMRMGALATVGYERPANLVHVLLDNGVHDSTGSQATVSHSVDLAAVAEACGYDHVARAATLSDVRAAIHQAKGLTFVHVATKPRSARALPRPQETPVQVAERLRLWLATRG